jgi:hypothetical protein
MRASRPAARPARRPPVEGLCVGVVVGAGGGHERHVVAEEARRAVALLRRHAPDHHTGAQRVERVLARLRRRRGGRRPSARSWRGGGGARSGLAAQAPAPSRGCRGAAPNAAQQSRRARPQPRPPGTPPPSAAHLHALVVVHVGLAPELVLAVVDDVAHDAPRGAAAPVAARVAHAHDAACGAGAAAAAAARRRGELAGRCLARAPACAEAQGGARRRALGRAVPPGRLAGTAAGLRCAGISAPQARGAAAAAAAAAGRSGRALTGVPGLWRLVVLDPAKVPLEVRDAVVPVHRHAERVADEDACGSAVARTAASCMSEGPLVGGRPRAPAARPASASQCQWCSQWQGLAHSLPARRGWAVPHNEEVSAITASAPAAAASPRCAGHRHSPHSAPMTLSA